MVISIFAFGQSWVSKGQVQVRANWWDLELNALCQSYAKVMCNCTCIFVSGFKKVTKFGVRQNKTKTLKSDVTSFPFFFYNYTAKQRHCFAILHAYGFITCIPFFDRLQILDLKPFIFWQRVFNWGGNEKVNESSINLCLFFAYIVLKTVLLRGLWTFALFLFKVIWHDATKTSISKKVTDIFL